MCYVIGMCLEMVHGVVRVRHTLKQMEHIYGSTLLRYVHSSYISSVYVTCY